MAGEPGLEPGPTESESVVLPLNYSPTMAGGRQGLSNKAHQGLQVRIMKLARLWLPEISVGKSVIRQSSPEPGKGNLRNSAVSLYQCHGFGKLAARLTPARRLKPGIERACSDMRYAIIQALGWKNCTGAIKMRIGIPWGIVMRQDR